MNSHPDIRLRPAWHVALPFLLGAFMTGVIGMAAQHRLTLGFSVLLIAWGVLWGLLARARRARFHAAIAAAVVRLPAPTTGKATWLGPATLRVRPRRSGNLLWSHEGLLWLPDSGPTLQVDQQQVALDAVRAELVFPFAQLAGAEHVCGTLSGDQLIFTRKVGGSTRFALPNPAVYTFVMHALAMARDVTTPGAPAAHP
ncbi:MAG: hypothetical protein FJ164_06500 [Gammaproteobacteria bacterium]|nr:hypothetical protein [Gammaproteobacteria bacterium]